MKRALSILLAALLLLVALPAVAEEEGLQVGLYVSDAGTEALYLYKEGVGVLNCPMDGLYYANGVVWTEDSLEIERAATPFAVTENVLSFTYGGSALALRYIGDVEGYVLGEQAGTAFAGEYEAEDGKKLAIAADGQGVYTDAAGEQPVFWGSFLPFYDDSAEGSCFILFGSYLGGMDFVDGKVLMDTEAEGKVTLSPAAAPEVPQAVDADSTRLISPAYDLSIALPGTGWTVEETEAGLLVSRDVGFIQYTFVSVALDQAPDAAALDAYADHIWTDGLMGAGVAYDAAETVRSDQAVGEAAGRAAATEWTRDEVPFKGDSVLWFANGRLYVALCVSVEETRPEALEVLNAGLLTFRTAEEASPVNQLPLDKAALEGIRDLPPVPVEVTEEQVYYGYRMASGGQTFDLVPFLSAMGMDPKSICLTLKADGTGSLQMMDEEVVELTWTEDTLTAEGESVPYIREGDHIIMTIDDEFIEFASAAEIEALLAETAEGGKKAEEVQPTAEELVGSWTFTKARAMGMEIPASMMGTEMSLVLSEDGTAILLADGSPTELEWTLREDGKVSLTAVGTEIFALTFDGTVLTLLTEANSVEMVFEKDA